ncbi:glycosyltransferase family 39 protein, partial [Coleofasciculus sp. LEGE 07081]
MVKKNRHTQFRSLLILGIIWLASALCDRFWFTLDHSVPAWDQADYLTGSLNYWQALQHPNWLSGEWWTSFWQLSSKIPPFTYIAAAIIQNIFGTGADQATLVQLIFSAILLGSVYGLGVQLFSRRVGLWAAGLTVLFPALYRYRLEFLLDYPLTAVVTFSFFCLTGWRNQKSYPFSLILQRIHPPATAVPPYQGGTTGGSNKAQHHGELVLKAKGSKQQLTGVFKLIDYILTPLIKGGTVPHRLAKCCNPHSLLWAVGLGFSLGVALMVKQTALFFLVTPILWVLGGTIRRREWGQLAQLVGSLTLSVFVFGFWYRTNWLLMLTSGKRATIDSAIAEGDPPLNTIEAWVYYWKILPYLVSWLLLLVSIVGLILYWKRRQGDKGTRGQG